jgi:MYXO-CTERM domain-containing protein
MRPAFLALGCALFLSLAPRVACAHFYIDYPDAAYHPGPSPVPWWHEDAFGSPQKLGPCGDEDDATNGGGGPTGVVTPFTAGETITLEWTEVIPHTGWFRIAIAANRADFVDPPIVVGPGGLSADAGIEDPPVLPVIADGVYPHQGTTSMTYPPYHLKLPNMTCPKCTIQLIQVMLNHPSNLGNLPDGAPNPDGFLYHHCIDISISAPDGGDGGLPAFDSGGPGGDSGHGSGPDAGRSDASGGGGAGGVSGNPATPASSGCGCTMASASPLAGGALSLLSLAALLRRRAVKRRRSSS